MLRSEYTMVSLVTLEDGSGTRFHHPCSLSLKLIPAGKSCSCRGISTLAFVNLDATVKPPKHAFGEADIPEYHGGRWPRGMVRATESFGATLPVSQRPSRSAPIRQELLSSLNSHFLLANGSHLERHPLVASLIFCPDTVSKVSKRFAYLRANAKRIEKLASNIRYYCVG